MDILVDHVIHFCSILWSRDIKSHVNQGRCQNNLVPIKNPYPRLIHMTSPKIKSSHVTDKQTDEQTNKQKKTKEDKQTNKQTNNRTQVLGSTH